MAIKFGLLIIGGYLLGSVPVAYLVAKLVRGIDIRRYGSGNVGAANALRVVSKWGAIPVLVFDLVKGIIAIWVAQWIGLGTTEQVVIGLAAVIGHNWPVFLGFNGGRGALTTLGVALFLAPVIAAVLLAMVLIFGLFRQMSVGVILAAAILPVCTWFFSQPLGNTEEPLGLSLGFVAILVVMVIRRLAVRRAAIAASISTGQLLVNRLFFDRDIRDREAWIHRVPDEVSSTQQPEKQVKG